MAGLIYAYNIPNEKGVLKTKSYTVGPEIN